MSAFTLYNSPFNKNSIFTFSGKHHLYLGVMGGNCPCFTKVVFIEWQLTACSK